MGDTVDALAYKANVPGRIRESVADKRDRLKAQMASASDSISESTPDGSDVRDGAQRAVGIAQENPLGLALGGVAVGFLVGLTMPTTRVEEEKVGPIAHDVRDKVVETGQEALEHGKEVAQDAASSAVETAKESGKEHASELADSAQGSAEEVAGNGTEAPTSAPGQPTRQG